MKIKKIGKGNIYFEVIEKDFDEEDKILTPIRIVLSKKKVGTLEDDAYFPIFISELLFLIKSDEYLTDIDKENYLSVLLYEDSFKQLTLGENFDDLSVVSAKNKNDIFFAWYRHTDRYSDALSEKNMIYTAYVSKKNFIASYNDLIDWYCKYNPTDKRSYEKIHLNEESRRLG